MTVETDAKLSQSQISHETDKSHELRSFRHFQQENGEIAPIQHHSHTLLKDLVMQESSYSSLTSQRSKSSCSKSDDVYANASIIDDMAIEIDDLLLNKGGLI